MKIEPAAYAVLPPAYDPSRKALEVWDTQQTDGALRVIGTEAAEQVFSVYPMGLTSGYVISMQDNQGARAAVGAPAGGLPACLRLGDGRRTARSHWPGHPAPA